MLEAKIERTNHIGNGMLMDWIYMGIKQANSQRINALGSQRSQPIGQGSLIQR